MGRLIRTANNMADNFFFFFAVRTHTTTIDNVFEFPGTIAHPPLFMILARGTPRLSSRFQAIETVFTRKSR